MSGLTLSGNFSNIKEEYTKGSEQAKVLQQTLSSQPSRGTQEMLRNFALSGGKDRDFYRVPDVRRGDTHPDMRNIPMISAVDTDKFMGQKKQRD